MVFVLTGRQVCRSMCFPEVGGAGGSPKTRYIGPFTPHDI